MTGLRGLPVAVQGALAFLTRLPVGGGVDGWEAFRRTPAAFPLAGYVVGVLLALPFLVGLPAPTTAALYLLAVFGVTGVTHADGLADLADAAAVHEQGSEVGGSNRDRRRAVLEDASVGVGGALAVAAVVVALALAALALASTTGTTGGRMSGPLASTALATVVAAEVGAKSGMAVLACLGSPAHEGLGSQLVEPNGPAGLVGAALTAVPAVVLAGPARVPGLVVVVVAGPLIALGVRRWVTARLGGVSGDAFGATNELGRVVGLHLGVVAWAL